MIDQNLGKGEHNLNFFHLSAEFDLYPAQVAEPKLKHDFSGSPGDVK